MTKRTLAGAHVIRPTKNRRRELKVRAVLVGACPDDMELRCAGTLALHTLRGEPLHKRAWQGDIRYSCANICKSKRIRSEPQSLGERGFVSSSELVLSQ